MEGRRRKGEKYRKERMEWKHGKQENREEGRVGAPCGVGQRS
jgi:hypothetical protein